jgi:hypothetical protein
MKLLATARPPELDPVKLAHSPRQREDLSRIMAGATAAHTDGLRVPGHLWSGFRPLGMMAALTAVAASAVVVIPLDRHPSAPHHGAPRSSAAAAEPGASTSGGQDGAHVDVRLELLSVARQSEKATAEAAYWQTTTRSESVSLVSVAGGKGQPIALRRTSTGQWSVGVRPGTGSLMISDLDAVTEPRTAADEARWRAAGSPMTMRGEILLGDNDSTGLGYRMGTRRPTLTRTNVGSKIYALGPRNLSYEDLRALPSDSTELRRLLERPQRQNSADTGTDRTPYLLRQAVDLVTMPVKPAVRAGAYRIMAELPGVRGLGHVTDPLGRAGVGFTFPGTAQTPLGSVEHRIVVDGSTGKLLCEQLLLVEPSATARAAGLDAGTTVHYSATLRMSWSESQITVPEDAVR